jgi:hypothetical protein
MATKAAKRKRRPVRQVQPADALDAILTGIANDPEAGPWREWATRLLTDDPTQPLQRAEVAKLEGEG